jgi:hypothetical protein
MVANETQRCLPKLLLILVETLMPISVSPFKSSKGKVAASSLCTIVTPSDPAASVALLCLQIVLKIFCLSSSEAR